MSGELKQLRTELADTITGLTVYDHVPARAQLPCAFVLPGAPYIEQGQTFGSRLVRFGVLLLAHPSLNQNETDQLDRQIEQAQHDLDAAGWTVESVQQPTIRELNGQDVLATEINVATQATFT